jgi:histidyl-tRNA synthetase
MSVDPKVNYSLPSGYVEFSPAERLLEQRLLDEIRVAAEKYGFCSVETPAVERLEVLQAKGNQGDNILYRISPIVPERQESRNREDDGREERALRFDHTVPLAAYVARHLNDISFPFARYQIDMVFRGERPKKGRYRSFRQCDFDLIGRGQLDLMYDALLPALINEIFTRLGLGEFLIRISNRKVLCGFFAYLGVEPNAIRSCIKIVDDIEKIGLDKSVHAFAELGISPEAFSKIADFVKINGTPDDVLAALHPYKDTSDEMSQGYNELLQVAKGLKSLGVSTARCSFDMSIARGLGYYTGTVYETTLIGQENLGSICSGGRYEGLVGIFAREPLPGVGISIGWTRLFVNLLERGILKASASNPAKVVVLDVDKELRAEYLLIASELRNKNIPTLSLFDERTLAKQLSWANKAHIPLCIVVGSDEFANKTVSIKNLLSREQVTVNREDFIAKVSQFLDEINDAT